MEKIDIRGALGLGDSDQVNLSVEAASALDKFYKATPSDFLIEQDSPELDGRYLLEMIDELESPEFIRLQKKLNTLRALQDSLRTEASKASPKTREMAEILDELLSNVIQSAFAPLMVVAHAWKMEKGAVAQKTLCPVFQALAEQTERASNGLAHMADKVTTWLKDEAKAEAERQKIEAERQKIEEKCKGILEDERHRWLISEIYLDSPSPNKDVKDLARTISQWWVEQGIPYTEKPENFVDLYLAEFYAALDFNAKIPENADVEISPTTTTVPLKLSTTKESQNMGARVMGAGTVEYNQAGHNAKLVGATVDCTYNALGRPITQRDYVVGDIIGSIIRGGGEDRAEGFSHVITLEQIAAYVFPKKGRNILRPEQLAEIDDCVKALMQTEIKISGHDYKHRLFESEGVMLWGRRITTRKPRTNAQERAYVIGSMPTNFLIAEKYNQVKAINRVLEPREGSYYQPTNLDSLTIHFYLVKRIIASQKFSSITLKYQEIADTIGKSYALKTEAENGMRKKQLENFRKTVDKSLDELKARGIICKAAKVYERQKIVGVSLDLPDESPIFELSRKDEEKRQRALPTAKKA